MASKVAIALLRENATTRLENAMARLGEALDIERPQLPKSGRDEALWQAQQLAAIADWCERVAAVVTEDKAGVTNG